MEFYNAIIKTALLGTERAAIDWSVMPEAIQARQTTLEQQGTKEEQLLGLVALATNYRNAGASPLPYSTETMRAAGAAEAETVAYCSPHATRLLSRFLGEDNHPLLGFWLRQCIENQRIVLPEHLPKLLEVGRGSLEYRPWITKIMGNRGMWLLGLNPVFKYEKEEITNENRTTFLEHGTLEQRIKALTLLFDENPSEGRTYLHENWTKAAAKEKVALLQILKNYLGDEDETFLVEQCTNKLQSVKEMAWELLKLLPNSTLINSYKNILVQTFSKKQERKALILSVLKIKLNAPESIDESVFKTGIEKESTHKSFSNPEFWISQLMTQVPPTFLETHLELSADDIAKQFSDDKYLRKFMISLVMATIKFKSQTWATALLKHLDSPNIELVQLLPKDKQLEQCEKLAAQFPNETMDLLAKAGVEHWSLEYSQQLLQHYAKNVYNVNKNFYKNVIPYIHKDIIKALPSYVPEQEYQKQHWINVSREMEELLELREEIKKFA
ncbi:MAG: hypothetical protein RLZZ292_1700 [Bacteroidota bacterium]|jgi:hypothetical protein